MGLADDLALFLDLLKRIDAPHMVVGALALDALASPRSTFDADVQVRLEDPPSSTSSRFHGWFIEERSHDEVFDQETLILRHQGSPYPIELFLTTHWLPTQALQRRTTVHSDRLDREIPLPTPEDFILLKAAYWQHPSRSKAKAAQDAVDIEAVAEHHHTGLDRAYLETHADDMDLWDALSELL